MIEGLGFKNQEKAYVEKLTQDVVKTSEIEGENLDANLVRSSIARKLNLMDSGLSKEDRAIDGIVDVTLDATENAQGALTADRLFRWHRLLFPTSRSGWFDITVGRWRESPMTVSSGPVGKEKIHFEAPPHERLDEEMRRFLEWFEYGPYLDWTIKAAVSHLWFVTIHPFEDGNGRIGRAISDLALSRSDQKSQRFYSMSASIGKERKQYYDMLERTQKGNLDITPWIVWFLNCLSNAIDDALGVIDLTLEKQRYWTQFRDAELNARQGKVLNTLLDEGKTSLKTADYARIAKCSADTAQRDIAQLIELQLLRKDSAGGRSTKYLLNTVARH